MNITPVNQNTTTFGARFKAPANMQDVCKFEQHIAPCFNAYEKKPIQGYFDGKSLSVFTGEDVKACDRIKIDVFGTRLGQAGMKHTIAGDNPKLAQEFAKEEKNGITQLDSFKDLMLNLVSRK